MTATVFTAKPHSVKISVIDIGTNSIHVIFAKVAPSGAFEIIGSDKEMVELGDGTLLTGILPEEAMHRALESLKRYRYLAQCKGVDEMIVVATSAVREALNGKDFVKKVREHVQMRVRLIDGREEARLIALAVQNSVALGDEKSVIVDIGGGSTELVVANRKRVFWLESLPLGSNRLKQMFPLSDPPKKKEIQALEAHVESVLKPVFKKLKNENVLQVVGTSGTLNTVARILFHAQRREAESAIPAATSYSRVEMEALYKKLATLKLSARRKIKGLNKKRAPMIVQGLSILQVLMRKTNLKSMWPCDKALREGLLLDHLRKRKRERSRSYTSNLRQRTVEALLEKYGVNRVHAEHVAKLSLAFFDALGLPRTSREILKYAAVLHDIGYHVSFAGHHRHSFYLILNSDLDCFSASDILQMAWVARFHRRDANRKNPDFLKLPADQQENIVKLAACLQLADALDCSHLGIVENIRVQLKRGVWNVRIRSRRDARWEMIEAQKRSVFFEKAFGRKIVFLQNSL